jgi:hypothetical protein
MNYDEYKVTIPYPERPRKPSLASKHTAREARAHARELGRYEVSMQVFRANLDEYRQQERTLEARFKEDALKEVGLTDHPNADKIYSYAWEKGNASGFKDVFYILEDLAGLIAVK